MCGAIIDALEGEWNFWKDILELIAISKKHTKSNVIPRTANGDKSLYINLSWPSSEDCLKTVIST